ncbi:MAG: GyrI-like domain-containing protein, partial [Alphaproteobacteria bacterium]|nr:GyrI-like domain-containing protein [Alphaproteobacteria bacterium]
MFNGSIIYLRATQVAIVKCEGARAEALPTAWAKLQEWLDHAGHRAANRRGYELDYDHCQKTPDSNRRYAVAVEVPPTRQPCDTDLIVKEYFDGGAYKVCRSSGSYAQMADKAAQFHAVWNGQNLLVLDHHRPVLTLYHSLPRV